MSGRCPLPQRRPSASTASAWRAACACRAPQAVRATWAHALRAWSSCARRALRGGTRVRARPFASRATRGGFRALAQWCACRARRGLAATRARAAARCAPRAARAVQPPQRAQIVRRAARALRARPHAPYVQQGPTATPRGDLVRRAVRAAMRLQGAALAPRVQWENTWPRAARPLALGRVPRVCLARSRRQWARRFALAVRQTPLLRGRVPLSVRPARRERPLQRGSHSAPRSASGRGRGVVSGALSTLSMYTLERCKLGA